MHYSNFSSGRGSIQGIFFSPRDLDTKFTISVLILRRVQQAERNKQILDLLIAFGYETENMNMKLHIFYLFQHYINIIYMAYILLHVILNIKGLFQFGPSFRKNWHRFFLSLPGWADAFQISVSIIGPRKYRRNWKLHLTPQKRVIWLQRREDYFRPSLGTN